VVHGVGGVNPTKNGKLNKASKVMCFLPSPTAIYSSKPFCLTFHNGTQMRTIIFYFSFSSQHKSLIPTLDINPKVESRERQGAYVS